MGVLTMTEQTYGVSPYATVSPQPESLAASEPYSAAYGYDPYAAAYGFNPYAATGFDSYTGAYGPEVAVSSDPAEAALAAAGSPASTPTAYHWWLLGYVTYIAHWYAAALDAYAPGAPLSVDAAAAGVAPSNDPADYGYEIDASGAAASLPDPYTEPPCTAAALFIQAEEVSATDEPEAPPPPQPMLVSISGQQSGRGPVMRGASHDQ